ncbi:MAG: hypothetical protein ACE5IK_05495 [Acidobacteriota bacterium]
MNAHARFPLLTSPDGMPATWARASGPTPDGEIQLAVPVVQRIYTVFRPGGKDFVPTGGGGAQPEPDAGLPPAVVQGAQQPARQPRIQVGVSRILLAGRPGEQKNP